MSRKKSAEGKEEPQRIPLRDLAFFKRYEIQYKTDEIDSFEGVIEKLRGDHEAVLSKKDLMIKELLKVVEEKTKELQQCEIDCEEKEAEVIAQFEERKAANDEIRNRAEESLRERQENLEETIRLAEERQARLEYYQNYEEEGHRELELQIKGLKEEIEKARMDYQKDKEFIHKLWEHFRQVYVQNESENLNALKMKYMDAAIDGLSNKENAVIRERRRLILEMEQQMSKIVEQKNEYRQQEKTAETYRLHLQKLRRKLYNLVPIPEWTYRMSKKSNPSEIDFVSHEEENLCEHENHFRVPLTVETVWANYLDPEAEDRSTSDANPSMIVNPEEVDHKIHTTWTFDKKRVIRVAHEKFGLMMQRNSYEINQKIRNILDDIV